MTMIPMIAPMDALRAVAMVDGVRPCLLLGEKSDFFSCRVVVVDGIRALYRDGSLKATPSWFELGTCAFISMTVPQYRRNSSVCRGVR